MLSDSEQTVSCIIEDLYQDVLSTFWKLSTRTDNDRDLKKYTESMTAVVSSWYCDTWDPREPFCLIKKFCAEKVRSDFTSPLGESFDVLKMVVETFAVDHQT